MRSLLKEIGIAGAILARRLPDGKLEVIDGHLRRDLDKQAEWPVLVTDLTAEEARLALLTHDPIAALAEADKVSLDALLATTRTGSEVIAAMLEQIAGQAAWQVLDDPKQMIEVPARIDQAAELQTKWGTARGQAWEIGPHRLVCGDCREKAVVRRLWREGGPKVRLIWTDPSYGVAYADKNRFLNRSDRGNRVQKPIANDHLTAEETEALFAGALAAIVKHCEPGAACYASVPGGPLLERFMRAFNASGFSLKHTLVWVKNQFVIGMSDYHFRHEPVLYGWIENGPHYFTDDRTQDSVFEVDKPHSSDLLSTMKPVELVARMIINSSRAGDLVWDSFLGSGTTLLAAHQLGRIGYGAEIDPANAAVCLERLAALGLEPKLIDG